MKSLPASKAAEEFLKVLDRLRLTQRLTSEFNAILKEEWATLTATVRQWFTDYEHN